LGFRQVVRQGFREKINWISEISHVNSHKNYSPIGTIVE
jgi:hypothetical protein